MSGLVRVLAGFGLAMVAGGSAWAGDAPSTPNAPVSVAAQAIGPAHPTEHDKLMNEVMCRNLDEDDTGSRVHHKTCMKRSEWLAYDKKNSPGYDPDSGKAVVRQ